MSAPAIELRDVSVAYRLVRDRGSSVQDFAFAFLRRRMTYERLWALRGVSLTVHPGELVAVVGPNGAGKTTLLKAVGRVLPPTEGRVMVRGLVAPMIELGAGFNSELTAMENIVLYGALLGHHPRWLRERALAIAEYAEVEEYIDVPLRSFSSGMIARLAFAVATIRSPEVLLVDEVLAVGDESFRTRSQQRLQEMIAGGTAVLLVTHSLEQARAMADRAFWLDHGQVVASGDPADVIEAYRASVAVAPQVLA